MFTENNLLVIILLIALLGGLQPIIFSKIVNYNLPKKKILLYIGIINILFVSLYTYFFDKEINNETKNIEHSDSVNIGCLFILYTLICITLPNLLYTYNINRDIMISHNALLYISPVFTLLISYFLYSKDITVKQFMGTSLIFIGSYFICD
jgi:drug/metabolite transporter (DMT)-like permease